MTWIDALYVNGATQPALIVNHLKQGYGRGKIALWTRVSTDAYFSNLRICSVRAHSASRSMAYPSPLPHTDADSTRTVVPLEGTSGLTLLGTHARPATYRGRKAVELTQDAAAADSGSLGAMALLERPELKDGTVEVWVAGTRGYFSEMVVTPAGTTTAN